MTESLARELACIEDGASRNPGPTGVATLAVLEKLLAAKALDPAQDICVVVSETGLKTEAEPPSWAATAFDETSLRRLVAERRGTRS